MIYPDTLVYASFPTRDEWIKDLDPFPSVYETVNKQIGKVVEHDGMSTGDRYIVVFNVNDEPKFSLNAKHLEPIFCYWCATCYIDLPSECWDGTYDIWCNQCEQWSRWMPDRFNNTEWLKDWDW